MVFSIGALAESALACSRGVRVVVASRPQATSETMLGHALLRREVLRGTAVSLLVPRLLTLLSVACRARGGPVRNSLLDYTIILQTCRELGWRNIARSSKLTVSSVSNGRLKGVSRSSAGTVAGPAWAAGCAYRRLLLTMAPLTILGITVLLP